MLTPRNTRIQPSTLLFSAVIGALALSAAACSGSDEVLRLSDEEEGAAGADAERNSDSVPAVADPAMFDALVDPDVQAARDEQVALALQEARIQWATEGAADYTVKVRRGCFCAPRAEDDVFVTVVDGEVVSALGLGASGEYDVSIDATGMLDWYTVAGMFGRIEANLGSADRIDVKFDVERGFPSELVFDYLVVSAEEGERFEMWDLTPNALREVPLQLER